MFSEDNVLIRALSRIGDIVILNILFLLFSIPIISMGASFSAVLLVLLRRRNDRDENVLKAFLHAFKANFVCSTIFYILSVIVGYLFMVNVGIARLYNESLSDILMVLFAFILFSISLFFYANLVSFEGRFLKHLRNALFMAFRHIFTSAFLFAMTAFLIYFSLVDITLFAVYLFAWSFFGFASLAYIYSYFLLKLFKTFYGI